MGAEGTPPICFNVREWWHNPATCPQCRPGEDLRSWTDLRLATALAVRVCTWLDAGGISHGRSVFSTLLEPARDLLTDHRPQSDMATWPPDDALVEEAKARVRRAYERARLADLEREG